MTAEAKSIENAATPAPTMSNWDFPHLKDYSSHREAEYYLFNLVVALLYSGAARSDGIREIPDRGFIDLVCAIREVVSRLGSLNHQDVEAAKIKPPFDPWCKPKKAPSEIGNDGLAHGKTADEAYQNLITTIRGLLDLAYEHREAPQWKFDQDAYWTGLSEIFASASRLASFAGCTTGAEAAAKD